MSLAQVVVNTMKSLLFFSSILILTFCSKQSNNKQIKSDATMDVTFYSNLNTYVKKVTSDFESIPTERKEKLKEIASFVQSRIDSGKVSNLTYICTHNSRRSHMSQIWAKTAAEHYGLGDKVISYSGGTESTAFNPRAVAAIERAGFKVENPGGENPIYKVSFAEKSEPMECFSKKYDDEYNAQDDFAAIMTCSDADASCPFIPGASDRIAIPYIDPKVSDGTDKEAATYDERCYQIAVEQFYAMSLVQN